MLQLPSTLTHDQALACLRDLSQALATVPSPAILDAAALTSFDYSALAVLLELQRAGARLNKKVVVQGLSERLLALATLYGVEALLGGA